MQTTPADPGTPPSSSARHAAGRCGAARLVAAVLVLLAVLVAVASPASAATSPPGRVTFGIEPASATGPDGRPNFAFGMTPGAVLFDHVAVVNYSATPLTLQVYATDATETSGGGFGLLPATSRPTGVGAWISLPPGSATVQVPGEQPTGPGFVVLPMTVHVPASTSPGDHVGGLVASLRTVGTNATGQTVVLNQRIGSRVFIRVAGTLAPQLTLSGVGATYADTSSPFGTGKVEVTYNVANSGNADLAVHDQQVTVSGLLDDTHTVRLVNIPLLLPGASVTERAVISGVWPQFRLHQTVSVQPVATSGSVGDLSPVSAGSTLWAVPWTLLVLVLVLVVGLVVWMRRRSRKAPGDESSDVGEGAGAPVESEVSV
jgi:hypothetical protein